MRSIFGIFRRTADAGLLTNISSIVESELTTIYQDPFIILGHHGEVSGTRCPDFIAAAQHHHCQMKLVSSARIDNREELATKLGIPSSELSSTSDDALIHHAIAKWGDQASSRIIGDWAFAAWDPAKHVLYVARDHHGNTALYYYIDHAIFAFSTKRQLLLDLDLAPLEMDELYLAQVITSWLAYHGERTIHKTIRRLPPAHSITVAPGRFSTTQYWHLENTPALYLARRDEYVSAFQEVFTQAVHARLRLPVHHSARGIAATLSSGLDSSAVAVTAAELLREQGRRLTAFTSVPLTGTDLPTGNYLGDEFSLAEITARFADNIDLFPVNAAEISPIQAIRRMLQITHEPCHAAGNLFWLLMLNQAVAQHGCGILLTGQIGNATISWDGDIFSQPLAFQLQRMGWQRWLKEKTKRLLPKAMLTSYRGWKLQPLEWYRASAINPEFARRLHILEQRLCDPDELPMSSPQDQRLSFIKPGRIMVGALHAEMGAAAGIEIRDPTADVRVIEFTYSVPDHIFIDPMTGQGRWLIREAMKGHLPDQVRLNRRPGRQAADRVQRLRACADEVTITLDELETGPAATYVDVAYMRQVWHKVLAENTNETFTKSGTVLTRGIMAGLFVNDFFK